MVDGNMCGQCYNTKGKAFKVEAIAGPGAALQIETVTRDDKESAKPKERPGTRFSDYAQSSTKPIGRKTVSYNSKMSELTTSSQCKAHLKFI